MSIPKKVIDFNSAIDNLKLGTYPVLIEANDRLLYIAIYVPVREAVVAEPDANGQQPPDTEKFIHFGYSINRLPNPPADAPITPDQVIIRKNSNSKNDNTAIYQFSIGYDSLRKGANSISLFAPPATASTPRGAAFNSVLNIDFFLKEHTTDINVSLQRPGVDQTVDQVFWDEIYKHYLSFRDYETFIDTIICRPDATVVHKRSGTFDSRKRDDSRLRSPFIRSDEYNLIKFATDFYMLAKSGLDTSTLKGYLTNGKLPYYDIVVGRIKDDNTIAGLLGPGFDPDTFVPADDCEDRAFDRIFNPIMIELIWSFWMEMGMLVQTMNVINLRFQNIKGNSYRDPLTRFDTDPLRPLSHILWGYIQDEQHRLSLPRRLSEYDHEYGLTLAGRAVPRINSVDSRVRFLEAFHSLLAQCLIYFHESDDTTRIADAFPILNSLKEVHLLLAEGNHNAYGNLTWTARQEMMMQQYILSRTEMREFLGGRIMVPYPETWMDRVDTMRTIQGWGGSGIVNYYELAVHGELILLSIRYGNWSDVTLDRNNAANWAQRFRNSIQRYIHAYRSVTGIDLSVDQVIQLPNNFATQPTFLIQQRMLQDASRIKRA